MNTGIYWLISTFDCVCYIYSGFYFIVYFSPIFSALYWIAQILFIYLFMFTLQVYKLYILF